MSALRHSRRQSFQPESTQDTLFEDAFVESGLLPNETHSVLGAQALKQSAVEPTEKPIEKEHRDPAKTMRELYERNGFYARDTHEESSMHSILDRSENPELNPVREYLFSVNQSQVSIGEKDPYAAPRSIVHSFESYAELANAEAKVARFFDGTAHARSETTNRPFSEVFTRDDLSYDDLTVRTLTSVVRRIEDELFAFEGKGKYPLHKRNGIDALKGKLRKDRVYEVLESMSLEEVLTYSNQVAIEEGRRFKYWHAQLVLAEDWEPVKKQAAASIAKLDAMRTQRS